MALLAHSHQFQIPVLLETHVTVDLQSELLALPQFLGLGSRPTRTFAVFGMDHSRAHAVWGKSFGKTMRIFLGDVLPHNSGKDLIGVGGLVKHILQSPLALRVAVTGDLHKNASTTASH